MVCFMQLTRGFLVDSYFYSEKYDKPYGEPLQLDPIASHPITMKLGNKNLPMDLSKPFSSHSKDDEILRTNNPFLLKDRGSKENDEPLGGFIENEKFSFKPRLTLATDRLKTPSRLFSDFNKSKFWFNL